MVIMNRESSLAIRFGAIAFGFLLAVCLAGPTQAAEVSASLDRPQVVVGETVTLVLQTDDAQQSLDTDLSGLNADFRNY